MKKESISLKEPAGMAGVRYLDDAERFIQARRAKLELQPVRARSPPDHVSRN